MLPTPDRKSLFSACPLRRGGNYFPYVPVLFYRSPNLLLARYRVSIPMLTKSDVFVILRRYGVDKSGHKGKLRSSQSFLVQSGLPRI